jgi:CheY-like chemotaxis protein/HPt (histidine-containing phosphotransfer) domain-containing protein
VQDLTSRGSAGNDRQIVVLLVDDQAFVGAAVGRLLATERDITLHCCTNALEAVRVASELNPSIILQDLVMPGIDGLTLVGLFRSNPPTSGTPVIVLSGNDDPDARTRALAQGASGYLVKLPAKDDLIAVIRRSAFATPASRIENGPGASGAAAAGVRPDADETLDRSILAAFREADAPTSSHFTRALIDRFLLEAGSQVETLKDAGRRSDRQGLEATAHSLKGSSMTMGARRLAALCALVEGDGTGKPDAVAAEVVLAELDREFLRLRELLVGERDSTDRI